MRRHLIAGDGCAPCVRMTAAYRQTMTQARYDAVAGFYISSFDSADDPAASALLGLLGPAAGLRILDVACGHGRISRVLARRGAQVAGVDIAGNLIRAARQLEETEPLGIRYVHADVTSADVLADEMFDAVTCSFGLSDIDDLDAAVAFVSRRLPPGGRFVFSILHPCFAGGKDISGSWPDDASYYDEGRWTAREARSTLRRQVGASHRMISTYLTALRQHQLWLDEFVEPRPRPDWDPAHDADRQPVFLAARCVKLAAPDGAR